MTIAILIIAYILVIGFVSFWFKSASRPDRQFLHTENAPPAHPFVSEAAMPSLDIERPESVEVDSKP